MSAFPQPHIAAASPGRASRRDQAARVLLVLAAAGALVAMISAIGSVADAGPATRMVETWRLLGFGIFAGLFALLAYRPRYYAGVWELAIANKFALVLFGLAYGTGTKDASNVLASDGTLALLLVAAYVLSRGWRAWSTLRASTALAAGTMPIEPIPAAPPCQHTSPREIDAGHGACTGQVPVGHLMLDSGRTSSCQMPLTSTNTEISSPASRPADLAAAYTGLNKERSGGVVGAR
jgi:hypothetical protein